MPIGLDPQATFNYILESDRGKEKAPTFKIRFLTGRQWRTISQVEKDLQAATDGTEVLDHSLKIINIAVIGWENMMNGDGKKITFGSMAFDEILTISEIMELMHTSIRQIPTIEDKKKLD